MREPSLRLSLQLQAGHVIADTGILVLGDGLKPNSAVRVELHSTPVLLGTGTTDANGSLRITVQMPHEVSAGTHHIVAIGTAPTIAPSRSPRRSSSTGRARWGRCRPSVATRR